MWVINCILLMTGAVAAVVGISFFLRNRQASGNISWYILFYGICSALWCICYGMIGITDNLRLCSDIRRVGIVGINTFLITEVFLVSEMSGAVWRIVRNARIFIIVISIIDFLVYSPKGVDIFMRRQGDWTTWVANPAYSINRGVHGIYILLVYFVLIFFGITWSRTTRVKRLRRFLSMVFLSNYIMLFFALPDTFLPAMGMDAVATSGMGAAACTMVMWYGATRLCSFDIRMGNIRDKIFDFLEAGIIVFDMDKKIAVVNRYAKMLGGEVGREYRLSDFFAMDAEQTQELFEKSVDAIYSVQLWDTGGRNAYAVRMHVLRDDCDEPFCYICVFVDVTEEVEAVSRLKVASRAKSRFLAQMSHEIRTPINAVLGMNEMILRESQDDEILEYAESIDSAGNTLLSLINSILDFSKIEDGKMDIVPVQYDTASFVNDLVNSIIQRADAKGLEFKLLLDETIPCSLIGDDVRFSQVIMNLLTNAVKYTEKGSVTLSIKEDGRADGRVRLFVSVQDTGIGIKEEDKDRLFESFERLDEIRNHNIEGTGLGISIVTSLLGMMGSRLYVESTYRKGSVFYFTIEQEIADETPVGDYESRLKDSNARKDKDDMICASGARILLVDDNDMNLKVAKNLLKLCGIKPDLASSGAGAIECMRKTVYDIVFLDHMMPELDGVETLHRLQEEDLIPPETVMIALTANAVVGARETYLQEGFSDYLSKPIEVKALVEKLRRYLPEEAYEGAGQEGAVSAAAPAYEGAGQEGAVSAAVPAVEGGGQLQGEVFLEFLPEPQEEQGILSALQGIGIDTEAGLGYCGGLEDFYIELVEDFVKAYAEKQQALQQYYEAGDYKAFETLIHALKSTARTIGATDLSELALALENAAGEEDADFLAGQYPAFQEQYRALKEELEGIVG